MIARGNQSLSTALEENNTEEELKIQAYRGPLAVNRHPTKNISACGPT